MKERVIFGATSNIGTAVARVWAQQKDRITLVGRSGDKLAILAKDLQGRGAESVEICVMNFSDLDRLWVDVLELFRDKAKVDTLLICQGAYYPGLEMNPEISKIQSLWEANYQSVITVMMAAKAHFVQNGAGTMAVVSSITEIHPGPSNYLYASSKAALSSFMKGFRKEVSAFGVRACTIVPGLVNSNVTKDWYKQGGLWSHFEMTGADIANRVDRESLLYTPKYWTFLAPLLRLIPESLFYRLKIW